MNSYVNYGHIVNARTQEVEMRIFFIGPDVSSVDEQMMMETYGFRTPPQYKTMRLIRDLDSVERMWMVNDMGRMTHYIQWNPPPPVYEPGTCPTCGDRGSFIRMALTCPTHGVFGGC